MKKPYLLLNLFLVFFCFKSYSQDTTSNDYFFDDGGISEAQIILKTNVLSLINGDATIHLETRLSSRLSIDASIGYQLPFYTVELPSLLNERFIYEKLEPTGGYSWSIQPKYYLSNTYPEASYMSVLIRRRNYNLDNYKQNHTDYALVSGVQFFLSSRILLDVSYGLGIRIQNSTPINSNLDEIALSLPTAIKIGFIL